MTETARDAISQGLELSDIPILRSTGWSGTEFHKPSRRAFIKGLLITAAVAAFGSFERAAFAHSSSPWQMKPNTGLNHCGYNYSTDSCAGCPTNRILSGTCAGSWHDHDAHPHKTGHTHDYRPNQCPGQYDGWYWKVGVCCVGSPCFKDRRWKCHDGYKGTWPFGSSEKSICRYVMSWGTSGCSPC